jgi:hypothetical protein
MSFRGRLARVERLKRRIAPDGACPGCGFRPGDIRTVVVGRTPKRPPDAGPQWQPPPLCEVVADVPDQPGRPRCDLCGGFMPPIALIEEPSDGRGWDAGDPPDPPDEAS